MGFGLPLSRWLKEDMREFIFDLLSEGTLKSRGLFNPQYVQTIVREHMEEKGNHEHRIWSLICLELWFQKFAN
jgi:asparagine synthase (glutamine-hydrolysing)